MNKILKEFVFNAETLAHVRGYEPYIIPLTDYVRFLTYELKELGNEELQAKLDAYLEKKKAEMEAYYKKKG